MKKIRTPLLIVLGLVMVMAFSACFETSRMMFTSLNGHSTEQPR